MTRLGWSVGEVGEFKSRLSTDARHDLTDLFMHTTATTVDLSPSKDWSAFTPWLLGTQLNRSKESSLNL